MFVQKCFMIGGIKNDAFGNLSIWSTAENRKIVRARRLMMFTYFGRDGLTGNMFPNSRPEVPSGLANVAV